jgi:hypothetical protein
LSEARAASARLAVTRMEGPRWLRQPQTQPASSAERAHADSPLVFRGDLQDNLGQPARGASVESARLGLIWQQTTVDAPPGPVSLPVPWPTRPGAAAAQVPTLAGLDFCMPAVIGFTGRGPVEATRPLKSPDQDRWQAMNILQLPP